MTAENHDALRLEVDGLVFALDAPPRKNGKKVVLTVFREGVRFVDRVDLYAYRSRARLASLVAEQFGTSQGDVLGILATLLDQIERALVDAAPEVERAVLTDERRRAAEALLRAPDLLPRAAKAMEAAGHVGEERTKALAYLIATSRLLDRPLSGLLLAPSGSGKSAVLEAVAAVLPPEDVVTLARLTPAALYYYSGEDALRHKLVMIDEFEGQADANHAVRVLQSKGELRLALPVQGQTRTFVARGPVAVMSGTTSALLDVQNLSRCLELTLDDSPEQTRRIHEAQARAWAGAARADHDPTALVDAQRLLEPVAVVVPYAPQLEFPARTTSDRRLSAKVLSLIGAHALLHQRQRERDAQGRVVALVADYAAIHALVAPQVERELEGLSPRAARAYRLLTDAGDALTRRELAARAGWNYMTSARALGELVAQELAAAEGREPPLRYRLLGGPASALGGARLTPPDAITERVKRSTRRSHP